MKECIDTHHVSASPDERQHRLRVSILTTSYPLRTDSVSGIFVQRLVNQLPAWIEPTILTPANYQTRNEVSAHERPRIVTFRYAPMKWQVLAHAPGGIPTAIEKNRLLYFLFPLFFVSMATRCFCLAKDTDVIHANWSASGLVAGLVGRLRGVPVVTTLRGGDVRRADRSWAYRTLLAACIYLSDAVVTVSDSLRQSVLERFPTAASKLNTISDGVGEDFLALPLHRNDGKNPLRILTIGNLIAGKGIDQILQALAQPNLTNAMLMVIGDGPERSKLEALAASLSLSIRVSFVGSIPPVHVPRYLADADVFVLASHSEGRASVVMEAMAAGLPVVATAIAGMDEIVKDGKTGFLFPNGDIQMLAVSLAQLEQDGELRQRLGQAGREFVRANNLVWQTTAEAYASLYENLARPSKMK
jgi:glycosyltransferase involved in cell wall biosynthesis